MSVYGNSYGDVVGASRPASFADFNYPYELPPTPPRHHIPFPIYPQHNAFFMDVETDTDTDNDDILDPSPYYNEDPSEDDDSGNTIHNGDSESGSEQAEQDEDEEHEHGRFPQRYGHLPASDNDDSASQRSSPFPSGFDDHNVSSDHVLEPEDDEEEGLMQAHNYSNYMSSASSQPNSSDIEVVPHIRLRSRSIPDSEQDQLGGLAYNYNSDSPLGLSPGAGSSSASNSGSESGSHSDPSSPQSDASPSSASDSSSESVGLFDRHTGLPATGQPRHLHRQPGTAAASNHHVAATAAQAQIGAWRQSRSPRRPSLTPTIHPNRRLPQPQQLPVLDSDSDSDHSMEAVLRPRELYRAPRINRGRASSAATPGRYVDLSDEEDDQPLAARRVSTVLLDIAEDSSDENRPLAAMPRQSPQQQQQPLRPRQLHLQLDNPRRRPSPFAWRQPGAGASNVDGDDELVEVVMEEQPVPAAQRQRNSRARNPQQGNVNGGPANPANAEIIDLTEEPDSPDANHNHRPVRLQRVNQPTPPRHPRRHMAPNGRTPSFARSDGSSLGNGGRARPAAPIIDLTSDSPQVARHVELDSDDDFADGNFMDLEARDNIPANRRLPAPVPNLAQRNRRRSAELLGFGRMLGNFAGFLPGLLAGFGAPDVDVQVIGANRHNPPAPHHNHPPHPNFVMNANPLAGNLPAFNYQGNGFGGLGGAQGPPKPLFEPPRPARPGFTRNTGPDRVTDEPMVVVCAGCDNELKYSTDDDDDGPRPAKRARTKKDREEHHFWAVRNCGHVSTLRLTPGHLCFWF